jgi:hypothetical protein
MSWHTSVAYRTPAPVDEDAPFNLVETLAEHSAAGTVSRDYQGGEISFFIDADGPVDAANRAVELFTKAATAAIGAHTVTGVDVETEDVFEDELARPLFPEVVGYAEIAEMGGVSRQRARQWADNPSFPTAVITTAQGPLMSKAAVGKWLTTRNTKPGRRTKTEQITAS